MATLTPQQRMEVYLMQAAGLEVAHLMTRHEIEKSRERQAARQASWDQTAANLAATREWQQAQQTGAPAFAPGPSAACRQAGPVQPAGVAGWGGGPPSWAGQNPTATQESLGATMSRWYCRLAEAGAMPELCEGPRHRECGVLYGPGEYTLTGDGLTLPELGTVRIKDADRLRQAAGLGALRGPVLVFEDDRGWIAEFMPAANQRTD
jgi:hypothetical protein